MITPESCGSFLALVDAVTRGGAPFTVHTHAPTRTVEEARNLPFDLERLVKTVAFRAAGATVVLAAVRGAARVDYARLAALVGVNRRALVALSPADVRELLGVEPGSVSPVPLRDTTRVFVDEDVLELRPTLFCGIGRCDRTLEIASQDLVRVSRARVAVLSRPAADPRAADRLDPGA